MKTKQSRKRGFSLVEMVITMAVTIILLSTITSLIVAVVNERKRSANDYDVSNNLYLAKNAVYDWYDNFAGENYTVVTPTEDNSITVTAAGKTFTITYNESENKLITPKYNGLYLSAVENMTFEVLNADGSPTGDTPSAGATVIRVKIKYRGGSQPLTMLLAGRAKNA